MHAAELTLISWRVKLKSKLPAKAMMGLLGPCLAADAPSHRAEPIRIDDEQSSRAHKPSIIQDASNRRDYPTNRRPKLSREAEQNRRREESPPQCLG